MPNQLFIWFYSIEQPIVDWLMVDKTRNTQQSGQQQDLTQLPSLQSNDEIIAIIPSRDVLLTRVKLPKTNYNKLMQAIPYALEEQLIDDVENLHFAIGDWNNEQQLTVAVITNQRLQQWLQKLADAGLQPDILIPSVFTLPPANQGHWIAAALTDRTLIRNGLQNGYSTDPSNFSFLLQLLLNEAKDHVPAQITLLNYTSSPVTLDKLPVHVEINNQPTPLLQQFATTLSQNSFINLLQGSYKPKQKTRQLKAHWGPAIWLGCLWLIVIVGNSITEYFYLSYKNKQLQQRVADTFHLIFPEVSQVVEPKKAIERQLNRLSAAARGSTFLELLAKTGDVLRKQKNIFILQLTFANNQLNLKLTANNFDDLADLISALQQQHLSVKQSNVTSQGKQVSAEVAIQ